MMIDRNAYNKYHRERVAARRAAFMLGKKCRDCGTGKDLLIHWGKRGQYVSFSYNDKNLKKALKDTPILCRSCRTKVMAAKHAEKLVHGTLGGYKYHGCKCKLCLAASAENGRMRRARKRRQKAIQKMTTEEKKKLVLALVKARKLI